MKTLKKFWASMKRNPVIVGFVGALLAQLFHDYEANQIDWTNITGYFATLFIGVWVREFTVPLKDYEKMTAARMEALALKRPTPGIPFPDERDA